jgi:hypothetical protein
MFAFLNNAHETNVTVYTPAETMLRADLLRQIREIEDDLKHRTADWKEKMKAWEAAVRNDQPEWTILKPDVDDISTGGQKYVPMGDGSFLAQGYAPTKHRVKLTAKIPLEAVTGIRLELLNDPNLPRSGPGRSIKGTGALTEFEVEAAPADGSAKPVKVKIVRATADAESAERPLEDIFADKSNKKRTIGPVAFAIDGKDETAWSVDIGPGRRNVPRKAVFVPEKPIGWKGGTVLTVMLKQNHGGWNSDDNQNCNLGRFRLSVTTAPDPSADPLPAATRAALAVPEEQRTPGQESAIFSHWRTTVAEWKEANDKIEELWRRHPEGSLQLALQERDAMRPTHLLMRGDFLKPAKEVTAGVPGFLHALPANAPATRLTFGRWLVDRKSPTASRSIVNRVWQSYFGTGLVATSEDFGSQASAPSHPELLDWLAVDFMDQGWSFKKLHRQIVTSSTYRQSSKVTADALARDPENRLLGRGARFRVDGEIVRDIALAASGLLNPKVGGASVYPPAPAMLFLPPVSYGPKVWKEETGENRYRRGIYTFRYRSVPYPALQAFDTPNGDTSCVRRTRSNTPLQALTSLNEPLFVECAQALATKTLKEGGAGDAERLAYAFRRCVGRAPSAKEQTVLLDFVKKQKERLGAAPDRIKELVGAKNDPTPEQAAWTAAARILLNLDETITRE